MATTKTFKTRIKLKYDLQSNWESSEIGFIPLPGELLLGKNADTPTKVYANVGIEGGEFLPLSVDGNYVDISLGQSVITAQEAISGHRTRIEALETAVGTGGSVDTQITDKINTLDVDAFQLASVSTDGDIVISGISEADGKIAAATGTTIAVEGNYSTSNPLVAKSYVDNINTTLTNNIATKANQSDLTALTTRVAANEGNITANAGAITANAEAITALAGRVTVNETAISNINTSLGTKASQDDLTALTGRVEIAESEIDTLQSEMDAVEAKAATALQGATGDDWIDATKNGTVLTLAHKTPVAATVITGQTIEITGIAGEAVEALIPFNVFDTTGHKNGDGNHTLSIKFPSLDDMGITGAMHFIGVKETVPTEGEFADGDVILVDQKEYVYSSNGWVELGDEGSYALKTVQVTGSNGLTGGGALTGNVTISHATTTAVTAAAIKVGRDQYGHVTTGDALTATDIKCNENTTVQAAIDAVEDRMTTAEGKINTNKAAIDENAAAIAANTQAIAGLDGRLTDAEGAIEDNAGAIAGLDGRLTTAEGAIEANEAAITEINEWLLILDCGTAESVTHTDSVNA